MTATCSIEGCARPRAACGYCQGHWRRWRKNGDPGSATFREKAAGRVCSVAGCERPYSGRGYCSAHEQRDRSGHGPGSAEVYPVRGRRTSSGSYSTAHRWVITMRGEAALHHCSDCAGVAAEWAYDHRDPDELDSPKGPYSLEHRHYRPLCKPCHRQFDADFAREIKAVQ